MEVIEKIVKRDGKYFLISADGSKRLGGPFDKRDDAMKRLKQIEHFKTKESFVWEVKEFNVVESKDNSSDIIEVSGTALSVCQSSNKRNYSFKNLEENNGKQFNLLVGHKSDYDNPDHNVGEGILNLNDDKLDFKGRVLNTSHHPDIIRQVKEGLVGPSIQGYGDVIMVKEDNGNISFNISELQIPLIALVNKHTRGVKSASIESAIAESFKSEMNEVNQLIKNGEGENKMSEDESTNVEKLLEESKKIHEKIISEKDEEINKLKKEAEDKKKALEDKEKKKVVESILETNKELKEEFLMEKSVNELNIINKYEKKLTESKDDLGISEVQNEGKISKHNEGLEGIEVNEREGSIGMTEERYKKHNKEVMESIYI